jgi:hypothetical protein
MKIFALAFVTTALAAAAQPETVNFDNAAAGSPPGGWTATQTGSGNAKWTVEKDDTAPSKPNVLKQSGVATYSICLQERHEPDGRFR